MERSKPEPEPEPEETLTMTYRTRKRSRRGGPAISYASSGCEGETVKHTPSVSQVADAPVTYQKVEIISRAENITTVEETGFCKAKNKRTCLNQQRRCPLRNRKSEKVSIELNDSENSAEKSLSASNSHGSSKGDNCNYAITEIERKLDDKTFQCYLQNLWQNFSEEKKKSFTHLDSLWYSIYSTERGREKVLKWIKKKDIFSKKYVFVPIVQWSHWSLLIFCHFDQNLESECKTKTPCMLLLDSLQTTGPKRLEPGIRKFVFDIYRTHGRALNRKLLNKMPFLVPKVPQQINGDECGFYVLYYINLFLEGAPENFSYSNGYPYFMKQDWFTPEGFNCFCETLDSSSDEDPF